MCEKNTMTWKKESKVRIINKYDSCNETRILIAGKYFTETKYKILQKALVYI